jgi:hypothetical protein
MGVCATLAVSVHISGQNGEMTFRGEHPIHVQTGYMRCVRS